MREIEYKDLNIRPLVSIIVPVYNTEDYLCKCLTSIIKQTLTNLEIILIDDGSTDSSGIICDEFEKEDRRIIVIHQNNKGLGETRNVGIAISKGIYIGFVDSDDYIAHDMYEKLLNAIITYSAQIAICGRYIVTDIDTQQLFAFDNIACYETNAAIQKMLTFRLTDVSVCDKLFFHSVLDGIKFPSGYIGEDIAVMFDIVLKASRIVHIGTPKYFNYQRESSMSRSAYSTKTDGIFIYPKMVRDKVLQVCPEMKREAEFYYLKNLLSGTRIVAQSQAYEKYKEHRTTVRGYWFRIMISRWFSSKEKMIATLHSINLYKLASRVLD